MLKRETIRRLRDDPVYFAKKIMNFAAYPYQKRLLNTTAKRIVAVWGRQSGKTTAISTKVIHFAYTNSNVTILIVSKGLRQSMIMFSVITNYILSNSVLRMSVARYTRTQFHLKNGSRIIALPCSQDGANLRGHTANMVIMDEAAYAMNYMSWRQNHARSCYLQRYISNACNHEWCCRYGFNTVGQKLERSCASNCIPHLLSFVHQS